MDIAICGDSHKIYTYRDFMKYLMATKNSPSFDSPFIATNDVMSKETVSTLVGFRVDTTGPRFIVQKIKRK